MRNLKKTMTILLSVLMMFMLAMCANPESDTPPEFMQPNQQYAGANITKPEKPVQTETGYEYFRLDYVSEYDGSPYVEVNGNVPYFTDAEITSNSYEEYAPLDSLGRCGVTMACVGPDIMPTEERGEIGMVKPTGWHTVRYDDLVDGNYLYNRCHLIGYQLTGENANTSNLITGTRYMNVDGMLPFENLVADYVEETENHVMYRVTPVFEGDNLVAHGVLMEAFSVEDNGEGVQFNVFCYNVQPGVAIDYATGESWEDKTPAAEEEPPVGEVTYVLNTSSQKFHEPACSSVEDMSHKNRQDYAGTREQLIEWGYTPCGACKP